MVGGVFLYVSHVVLFLQGFLICCKALYLFLLIIVEVSALLAPQFTDTLSADLVTRLNCHPLVNIILCLPQDLSAAG